MRVLCLVLPLVAGHEGSMEEVLARGLPQMCAKLHCMFKQDPPLTLSQIPEERRCLLCHTIAKGWARALESKVASLPTRQLHEEEFIDVLETICINNSVKEPCGLGTSMAVSTYSGVCRGGRLVAYLRQAQGHSCRAPMHS
ncbi:unnamed protein product [Durusdinium trenchii]|uniref:Uncharacterized protein n=1 Tax=Durusdinium trenchii TaxID=1381693 RepID=A0ABP0MCJ7_9DINO